MKCRCLYAMVLMLGTGCGFLRYEQLGTEEGLCLDDACSPSAAQQLASDASFGSTETATADPAGGNPEMPAGSTEAHSCAANLGYLSCESFDAYASITDLQAQPDMRVSQQNGSVSLEIGGNGHALTDRYIAARTQGIANQVADASVEKELSQAITSGALHVRTWIRTSSGAYVDGSPHDHVVFGLYGGAGQKISIDFSPRGEVIIANNAQNRYQGERSAQRLLPTQEWMCLEMGIALDDTQGSVTLSLNGQEIARQQGVDTLPDAGFGRWRVGVPWTVRAYPIDIDVAQVAVSTSPIGCG